MDPQHKNAQPVSLTGAVPEEAPMKTMLLLNYNTAYIIRHSLAPMSSGMGEILMSAYGAACST